MYQPKLNLYFNPPIINDSVGLGQLKSILVYIGIVYPKVHWWFGGKPIDFIPFIHNETDNDDDGYPEEIRTLTIGYDEKWPDRLTYGQFDDYHDWEDVWVDGWDWYREHRFDADETSAMFDDLNESVEGRLSELKNTVILLYPNMSVEDVMSTIKILQSVHGIVDNNWTVEDVEVCLDQFNYYRYVALVVSSDNTIVYVYDDDLFDLRKKYTITYKDVLTDVDMEDVFEPLNESTNEYINRLRKTPILLDSELSIKQILNIIKTLQTLVGAKDNNWTVSDVKHLKTKINEYDYVWLLIDKSDNTVIYGYGNNGRGIYDYNTKTPISYKDLMGINSDTLDDFFEPLNESIKKDYTKEDLKSLYDNKTLLYEINNAGEPVTSGGLIGDGIGDILYIDKWTDEDGYTLCYKIEMEGYPQGVQECLSSPESSILGWLNDGTLQPVHNFMDVDMDTIFESEGLKYDTPKIGDKLTYIGKNFEHLRHNFTVGKLYSVANVLDRSILVLDNTSRPWDFTTYKLDGLSWEDFFDILPDVDMDDAFESLNESKKNVGSIGKLLDTYNWVVIPMTNITNEQFISLQEYLFSEGIKWQGPDIPKEKPQDLRWLYVGRYPYYGNKPPKEHDPLIGWTFDDEIWDPSKSNDFSYDYERWDPKFRVVSFEEVMLDDDDTNDITIDSVFGDLNESTHDIDIKVGDILLCHTDLIMDYDDYIEANKGNNYIVKDVRPNGDILIKNNSGINHIFSTFKNDESYFGKWFYVLNKNEVSDLLDSAFE